MMIWIIFLVQALVLIYVGLNRGFAKSLISFLVNLFNIILAFLIARIFVNSMATQFAKELIKNLNQNYSSELSNLTVVENFAKFGMSVLVGIGTFYVLYCIIHIINSFVKPVLFYGKISDKIKYDNRIATIIVSLLSTVLTFMVFITPLGVIYNFALPAVRKTEIKNRIPFVSTFFFDKLTEMPDNEIHIKTSDEIECAVNVYIAAENIINNTDIKDSNIKLFRKNFQKSYFLPTVIAEVGSVAAEQWKNGDEFLGARLQIPEGKEGELVIKFLNIVTGWNKKVIVDDVNTILDMVQVIKSYGSENVEKEDGLLSALADEEFTGDLFVILYGNQDFASMIPAVLEYSLETIFESIHIEMKEEYVSHVDVSKMSEEDVRREGKIVSEIVATALEIKNTNTNLENGEISAEELEKMIEVVSKLKDSKVLGEIANEFVDQFNNNLEGIEF